MILRLVGGLAAMVLLGGCATARLPEVARDESDPAALALVRSAARAQGVQPGRVPPPARVSYNGDWYAVVKQLQPELVDAKFRKSSVERYDLRRGRVEQSHRGPGGEKRVVRERGSVRVWYNGVESREPAALACSALVADAYAMFLHGPAWFASRGDVVFQMEGVEVIDGRPHDVVAARLRPGFGFAVQDTALLFLDRGTRRMTRALFSLEGYEGTRGAEVDVTFSGWVRRGGVEWPTEFFERVRHPLRVPAHRWRLVAGPDLGGE